MTINAVLLKCYFMFMSPLLLLVLLGEKKKDEPQSRATPFCFSFYFFVVLFFEVCLCLRVSRLWDCVSCSLIYVRKHSKQHSGTLLASFVTLVWELFCELVRRKKKATKQTKKKKRKDRNLSEHMKGLGRRDLTQISGSAGTFSFFFLLFLLFFLLSLLLLFSIPQLSL